MVREQIDSVLHALPTLTASERAAISGGLNDQTNGQVGRRFSVTPEGASQAGVPRQAQTREPPAPSGLTFPKQALGRLGYRFGGS